MSKYLGVDIGGTKIAVGIVSESGEVLKQLRVPTPAAQGGSAVLRAATDLSRQLLIDYGKPVFRIGIGAGGQVDSETGTIISATDLLPGWAGQEVGKAFAEAFQVPAFVENDVNALALGEFHFGIARDLKTVAFLALGTGVGGALLTDGKIHHGAHWSGGEFGHLLVSMDSNARMDSGGHRGTLEAYASGQGLVTTYRDIIGDDTEITGEELAEAALEDTGSPAYLAVMQTGRYLGFGLVTIANMLDPDLIVIGGGLALLGDMLLDPAIAVLKAHALPGPAKCSVQIASLGADASIIGAAAVAMDLPL